MADLDDREMSRRRYLSAFGFSVGVGAGIASAIRNTGEEVQNPVGGLLGGGGGGSSSTSDDSTDDSTSSSSVDVATVQAVARRGFETSRIVVQTGATTSTAQRHARRY